MVYTQRLWTQLSESVYENNGRRLHMLGTLQKESGEIVDAYRWPGSLFTHWCIRCCNGDKCRGLLLWAELVSRNNLAAQIESSLSIVEHPAARDQGEEIYQAGFRTALIVIATVYDLNIPDLRSAEAVALRRNRPISKYDMRL